MTSSVLIDHIEVCRLLGIRPDTWRKRVQAGRAPLPHSVMGRHNYYRARDVRDYLRLGKWPARMKFRNRLAEAEAPGPDPPG